MQIELFLGDAATGKSLGTVEAEMSRSGEWLWFSHPHASPFLSFVQEKLGAGYGDRLFALVADGTVYEGCSVDSVAPPGRVGVRFMTKRPVG